MSAPAVRASINDLVPELAIVLKLFTRSALVIPIPESSIITCWLCQEWCESQGHHQIQEHSDQSEIWRVIESHHHHHHHHIEICNEYSRSATHVVFSCSLELARAKESRGVLVSNLKWTMLFLCYFLLFFFSVFRIFRCRSSSLISSISSASWATRSYLSCLWRSFCATNLLIGSSLACLSASRR